MTHHIIFVNKFVSKALTETEQKYSIIEGEAPGLVWGLGRFHSVESDNTLLPIPW